MLDVDAHDEQEYVEPQRTFMEELLGDDYVPNEQLPSNNHNNPQVQVNVVNFDDFSKSNQHCELAFINLLEQ
jgi:hypothetical protein